MKIATTSKILSVFFIIIVIWWFMIFLSGSQDQPSNFYFVLAYGFIPLLGGIFGLRKAKKWGFYSSSMGRALIFISAGLITWSIGETIWSYYNLVLQVEIPYPSLADVGFILSWPLWTVGIIYLSHATGARFALKETSGRTKLIIIPILVAALSYYFLVIVARDNTLITSREALKTFFDLAYPLGDVVILTVALVVFGLSSSLLGGTFKWPVLITLAGFVINYFGDFAFSYTTTVGTYFNAAWPDFLFATAMFVIGFGINSFDPRKA